MSEKQKEEFTQANYYNENLRWSLRHINLITAKEK